jgi:hypothetical protein
VIPDVEEKETLTQLVQEGLEMGLEHFEELQGYVAEHYDLTSSDDSYILELWNEYWSNYDDR